MWILSVLRMLLLFPFAVYDGGDGHASFSMHPCIAAATSPLCDNIEK